MVPQAGAILGLMAPNTDFFETIDPAAALRNRFSDAILRALGDDFRDSDPVIRATTNPEFGDFQVNAAMGLGKRLKRPPREVALEILQAVDLDGLAEEPEIAGPGFINVRIRTSALVEALNSIDADHLGVAPSKDTHPVVIDLCGVNVAKQLHVGHLRSTIIGDALGRILERRGRTVLRENHLGDWGLPIAMVLHRLRIAGIDLDALKLVDLDTAYRDGQLVTKMDVRGMEIVEERNIGPHRIIELEEQNEGAQQQRNAAAETLVALQQGDAELVSDWQKLIDCTMRAVVDILEKLNVLLGTEHNRGESFYRTHLPGIIDTFVDGGLAVRDDGALIVRFPDRERPMLIQKSNGGYLYATTDLAAIRHRVVDENADRVVYVVDARQRDHFKDLFDAARMAGWGVTADGHDVEMVHIPFGSVLGMDKKPLKTRSGDNVTLASLLDEAISRGRTEVHRRAGDENAPTHGFSKEELDRIGEGVGIGAIKYADLSNDLVRDYVFDMDRMIAFEGDTGPYLQYAHARICSIIAKADEDPDVVSNAPLIIGEPAERALALQLLQYGPMITEAARHLEPHRICTELHGLAETFNSFYQQCPVRKAATDELRRSRLRLCDLSRRVLADGLGLLGIEAIQTM